MANQSPETWKRQASNAGVQGQQNLPENQTGLAQAIDELQQTEESFIHDPDEEEDTLQLVDGRPANEVVVTLQGLKTRDGSPVVLGRVRPPGKAELEAEVGVLIASITRSQP